MIGVLIHFLTIFLKFYASSMFTFMFLTVALKFDLI